METVNDTVPPTDTPPPYGSPGHRLTRSTDDKVVAGLAGGLGRYFGIDPVVFRIAFVVLTLAGGSGLLLYLVGWLMIPDDAGGAAVHRFGSDRNSKLVAAILAGIGLVLLLDGVTGGHDDVPVALVLFGLGALVLWSRRENGGGGPPARPGPPVPPTDDLGTALTVPPTPAPPVDEAPPATAPRDDPNPRSAIVPVTLSLLAILAGGLTLVGVSAATGLALALVLTGGALVVGAWRGRARWLIPVGLALSVALATASVIDVPIRGGAGDVRFTPAALDDIRSPYRLGAGDLVLDLGDLDLHGETVTIVASVAAGRVQVRLPKDAAAEVDAHVGAGNLDLVGRRTDGLDVSRTLVESGREGGGRLVLRARAGVGEVQVQRASA